MTLPPTRIAFVDDDPHVLRGIRRAMADQEDSWEMEFFASGEEALVEIRRQPFDVVVSDMRMPGMDGATLLSHVRALNPATIRVILSGYADADAVLRTVGPAHTYLAKPCDAETLLKALHRQISLRSLLDTPALHATLAGLTNLPSLPEIYGRLQAELISPDCSPKTVADIIAQDMAMTAQVLKVTNSAYFSAASRITTPLHAVRMLGIEVIQALVLQAGLFRQFAGKPDLAPLLEALTKRGLEISALAERIAATEGGDVATAKSAQIAAMLADIGGIVLLDAHPAEYQVMLAGLTPDETLHQAEIATFGASHAAIGGYLLGLWGFSDLVVEALVYHCAPSACPGRDNLALTALHAASVLGPPSPLLPPGSRIDRKLDMTYLIEARHDGHIPLWRDLAGKDHNGD
ncbi:response regulator [Magnetospirillum molischianum]|uniref:Putative two-component response transcriptional regulator containing a CheY-like receiver domain and an HTH DNA-binding domain n=1 Tax=Magnetospirillum molischianum DSM 120 TaxID=1150626 RepID=H8FNU5_MAGML|nr:response regulator [Magnetospirillum molischianum]CCG40033.1 Putative two-component response transcriptional regulator containing a CheY-like receiver domain and an HTH DNA-binding domain [Magnetospirillum molischianum DSM 120]